MCLAFTGKVKKIFDKKVLVAYKNGESMALLTDEKVKVGDSVLVQMGIIIKVLTGNTPPGLF